MINQENNPIRENFQPFRLFRESIKKIGPLTKEKREEVGKQVAGEIIAA